MSYLIDKRRLKTQEILGNYQISKHLSYLKKAQFFSKEKILHNQAVKLTKLINFASKHIKFYSDFFKKNNLSPSEIKKPADLLKLPVMTKELYRNNFPNYLTDQRVSTRNFLITHTSGSTGVPIEIFTPNYVRGLYAAETIFFFEWIGRKYGAPFLKIWGGENQKLRIKFFNKYIENALVVNALNLSDNTFLKLYTKIMKKKPKFLEAFTSSAHALALLLEKHDLELNILSTVVSGETLHAFQRDIIKDRLNTDIYSRYGFCDHFDTGLLTPFNSMG